MLRQQLNMGGGGVAFDRKLVSVDGNITYTYEVSSYKVNCSAIGHPILFSNMTIF